MKLDRPSHAKNFRRAQALITAAALLLSACAPAFAQQPTPAPSPTPRQQTAPAPQPQSAPEDQDETISVNTNLVQVDAVVLDKKGRQVTDLQAADFEIVEDGRVRPPEFSSYVPVAGEGGAAASPAGDDRLGANEVRRSIVFIVANPVIEVKNNVINDERPFATAPSSLLLSQAVTDAGAAEKVLSRFVEQQMGAHDLAAIRESEGPSPPLGVLTTDRALLRRAIERVGENPVKKAPKVTVIFGSRSAALRPLVEQNLRVLQMMDDAVAQLSRLPGRKVVVLVSRGMLYALRELGVEAIVKRMDEVIAKANRARVTFYTLNPRGVSAANLRGGGLQDNGGLMALARETGGRAVFNANDLTEGFGGILEENRGYYLLGYNPGAEAAGRPHNIEVRVRRPGLRVQARSTAYAAAAATLRGPVARPQLVEVLDTPLAVRDVKLKLTPLYLSADGRAARIVSLVNIDLAGAEWKANADGTRSASLDVVGRVVAPDGRVLFQKGRSYSLSRADADAGPTAARGIDYWFDVAADSPGLYLVSVAVRDAASGRAGNAAQHVEAADLARGGLGISSLLLSSAEEEERASAAIPSAARPTVSSTTPSTAPSTVSSNASSTVSSAAPSTVSSTSPPTAAATLLREESLAAFSRRELRAGGTLRYRCYVYNARRGGASELQAQLTIRRGDAAQLVLPARAVAAAGDPVSVGGDIALGSLPAGRYTLEVVITDRRSRAVASSDFHVTDQGR